VKTKICNKNITIYPKINKKITYLLIRIENCQEKPLNHHQVAGDTTDHHQEKRLPVPRDEVAPPLRE